MLRGKEKGVLHIDVVSLMKKIELILKILVETQITSKYRSVFKGKGLEFEDFRIYTPGDDASSIDWKTSARSENILIKTYKEERELNVYFLLDVSSKMIFGSTETIKMEYAAEVVAALSYLVNSAGDKPGLVMFSDQIVKMLQPSMGKKHFFIILRNLVDTSLYGGGFDIEKPINYVLKTTKGRGMMFIVSDFIAMPKNWDKAVRQASLNFDVVGIQIRDPRDIALPVDSIGQVVLGDPFSDRTIVVDPKNIREVYDKYVRAEDKYIRHIFESANADLIKLNTGESYLKPLIGYFMKRGLRL